MADLKIEQLRREAALGGPEDQFRLAVATSRSRGCCGMSGWRDAWTRCDCGMPVTGWHEGLLPPAVEKMPSAKLMEEVRDRWVKIGLATGPTDWDWFKAGVELAYAEADLECPVRIERFGSPHEALNSARISARDSVWNSVLVPARNSVKNSVLTSIRTSVWNSVRTPVWGSVGNSVLTSVWGSARGSVGALRDAHWLAFYETFDRLGLRQAQRLRGLSWCAQSTGLWWPCKDEIVVSERPEKIELDDQGRLVGLVYPDGTKVTGEGQQ